MVNPFSNLKDEKLMELYKNGDNMAFEVIYERHKDRVYSYLDKRLSNVDLIDDIFQNTFIKFHKSRSLYNDKYPLLKWIYVICRSELLDSVKRNKVSLVELKDHHITSETQKESQFIDLDEIASLSEKERGALKLRYYFDKDFDEISESLKTSEGNSRKLISRGLKKLRAKFSGGIE